MEEYIPKELQEAIDANQKPDEELTEEQIEALIRLAGMIC